jgi:hypothetical protein
VKVTALRLVHADPDAYCAHPHGVRLANGEIIVVFNRAPRREIILHPPQDSAYRNVLIRSLDGGQSWTPPIPVPELDSKGYECAGLTALRDGRILLNQWRFRWYPMQLAHERAKVEPVVFPQELAAALLRSSELDSASAVAREPEEFLLFARGPGQTLVRVSHDAGRTWALTVPISTSPYPGGYGMRGAIELGDGSIVLPLSDVPHYKRIFIVRSQDGGVSWSAPIPVAKMVGLEFEEPAPLLLPAGRILILLRENTHRTIYATHSDDDGETWSLPRPTGIDGYPAHLLSLDDGRILCTYGFRRPPFAVRAVVSDDDGATWKTSRPISIREGLPNKDLGYPFTLKLGPDKFLTAYYAQDPSGVTGIWSTTWSP